MSKKKSNSEPSQIITELECGIKAGLNILLEGNHGVGKTSFVFAAASRLRMHAQYFSASTLDPFADLVGIPVPILDADPKQLIYLRPEFVGKAEILIFDELNRAPQKTLNSVFEIIQFRTINGEKLPNLRSVVAAINPAMAGYQVQELDPALVDRFHLIIKVACRPDSGWFRNRFPGKLGEALLSWYNIDLEEKERQVISNRRLEYIGSVVEAGIDPSHAIPIGTTVPINLLQARILDDKPVLDIEHFTDNPEQYLKGISGDANVGIRFTQLLPLMTPKQKFKVRELVLALPNELLASFKTHSPKALKDLYAAVTKYSEHQRDAEAYEALLEEKIK